MLRKLYDIWTSFMNYKNRKLLVNRTFSIISNSCIGNVIYHKLDIPYMSAKRLSLGLQELVSSLTGSATGLRWMWSTRWKNALSNSESDWMK